MAIEGIVVKNGNTGGTDYTMLVDGGATGKAQIVKLGAGVIGSEELIGTDDLGTQHSLWVANRPKLVTFSWAPSIDTAVYTAKDALGTVTTITNAARANGFGGSIRQVIVSDRDQEMKEFDLVFFSAAPTTPTNNAVFDPTDAENDNCLGTITVPAAAYRDFNDNSIATVVDPLDFVCGGSTTSIYCVLVARGTPTFTAATDLKITVIIEQY